MAATAAPSGCDIWRMPIARPRRSAGNQPTTTRPLAAFADAEAAPARRRNTASHVSEGASAAPAVARAANAAPSASTRRSPVRSTTQPHATSVHAVPIPDIATIVPASGNDAPSRVCSVGRRNADPATRADAAPATSTVTARIAHRRASPSARGASA